MGRRPTHARLRCALLAAVLVVTRAQGAFGQSSEAARNTRDLLQQIGARVQDNIPLAASSTSYTYTFNRDLDAWERSPGTSGPILVERAQTVGRGRFDLNVSYGYIRFTRSNGRDFDDELTKRTTQFGLVTFKVKSAEAQLVDFNFIWGLRDDLDLALVVPVERVYFATQLLAESPPPGVPSEGPTFHADHFGVGDVQLRAKWLALTSDYVNVALGSNLKLPSGDEDKALGVGDTRLDESAYVSRSFFDSTFEPHANLGVEVNLADARKSRLLYAGGVTCQVWTSPAHVRGLSLTLDVVGKADLVPPNARDRGSFFGTRRQNNILDLAPGVKVSLSEKALIYGAVQLPLTDDAIRADYTPIGGFEYVF